MSQSGREPCLCGCGEYPKTAAARYCVGHWKGQPKRKSGFPWIEGAHYIVNAETGCWEWTRFVNEQGYASCGSPAHRRGYEALFGPIPRTHDCHHKCRNPLCVNPDHLAVVEKFTHRRKHRRDESHLTEQDIVDMREAAWNHVTLTDLAAKYGLTITTVGLICKGKKWKDVGGPVGTPPRQCTVCGDDIVIGNRKRTVCSNRCETRRNYLAFTAGRKRQPKVEARWAK